MASVSLVLACGSSKFCYEADLQMRFGDLRRVCAGKFSLDVDSVKLIGFGRGRQPPDDAVLADLVPLQTDSAPVKPKRVNIIGTRASVLQDMEHQSQEHALREQQRVEEQRLQDEQRRVAEQQRQQQLRAMEEERQRRLEVQRQEEAARTERHRLESIQREQQRLEEARQFDLHVDVLTDAEAAFRLHALLPSDCLRKILAQNLSFPLIFQVTSPRGQGASEARYVSVKEFTAPDNTVQVADAVADALHVSAGDMVHLELMMDVPQCSSLQLQPLTPEWRWLPHPERDALLEFHLRKRQFLVQGEVLRVENCGVVYEILVKETQPQQLVVITDTDLATDVLQLEAEEPEFPEVHLGGTLEVHSGDVAKMVTGDEAVELAVEGQSCLLFVSEHSRCPGPEEFSWSCNGTNRVLLSPELPGFTSEHTYYFVVHSTTSERCRAKVSLSKAPPRQASSNEPEQHLPTQPCPNCRRHIPSASMMMHELQCARATVFCQLCQTGIRRAFQTAHEYACHKQWNCRCGYVADCLDNLRLHRSEQCRLLPQHCIYCAMRVPLAERGPHQYECGLREAVCVRCGFVAKRKEMRRHISREHHVEIRSITLADFR